MEILIAVILGIVQGLTEFLPVSSSGHLIIFQRLFGLKEAEVVLDICVHLGTLVAVIAYFRNDIKMIITGLFAGIIDGFTGKRTMKALMADPDVRICLLIIISTLPTGLMGVFFGNYADALFGSVTLAGAMIMVTGVIMWLTKYINYNDKAAGNKEEEVQEISTIKAFLIGIVQGFAIIPGISRSGSTIAASLAMGISRENAARYSFLISIPAISGAAVLHLKDITTGSSLSVTAILLGTLTACVTGYLSLAFLVFIVKKGKFHLFSPYCFAVGLAAVIYGLSIN